MRWSSATAENAGREDPMRPGLVTEICLLSLLYLPPLGGGWARLRRYRPEI